MSRFELLSPEGLRVDGRRWTDGSSFLEQGNTKVICMVTGPLEPAQRSKQLHDRASVTVQVYYAAFSGMERKKRGRNDKRIQEMNSSLQQTFSQAILTHLHPRSEITISLHVISQDGSVLAACINAATLAIVDAGIPITDYVVAVAVGSSSVSTTKEAEDSFDDDTDPILDLNGIEENELPSMTVATLGKSEKITLLQMESKVPLIRLDGMLALAIDGCSKLTETMNDTVKSHGLEFVRSGAL